MKKVFMVIGICFLAILTSGCFSKNKITAEDFKTTMMEKGYAVAVDTDILNSNEVKNMYIALKNESDYQIEFYEFNSEEYAKEFYTNNKEIFLDSKNGNYSESEDNGRNYKKYTMSDNNHYKVVVYVENTAIYLNVRDTYMDEVKHIIKSLGY